MPGITRVSAQIQNLHVLGRRHIGARLDRADLAAFDHDILIVNRLPARSVDHAHMGQHHFWRVYSDIFQNFFGKLRRRLSRLLRMKRNGKDNEREQPLTMAHAVSLPGKPLIVTEC